MVCTMGAACRHALFTPCGHRHVRLPFRSTETSFGCTLNTAGLAALVLAAFDFDTGQQRTLMSSVPPFSSWSSASKPLPAYLQTRIPQQGWLKGRKQAAIVLQGDENQAGAVMHEKLEKLELSCKLCSSAAGAGTC